MAVKLFSHYTNQVAMLIFGHYSFCIQKHHPSELPFKHDLQPDDTIELRMQVVHVFWIPIFPFGKIWIINPGNGNKGKVNEQMSQVLDLHFGRRRTPWYSFLGIILILLSIPGGKLYRTLADRHEIREAKEHHAAMIKLKADFIENPSLIDFHVFGLHGNGGINKGEVILKVDGISSDSILFKQFVPTATGFRWSGDEEGWRKVFADSSRAFNYFTVAKKDLQGICDTQYTGPGTTGYRGFPGKKIAAIDTSMTVVLGRIVRFKK